MQTTTETTTIAKQREQTPAPSSSAVALVSRAAAVFRRAAERNGAETAANAAKTVEEAFEAEVARINEGLAVLRAQSRSAGTGYLPALYLRGRDPIAEEVLRQLRDTSKSFELNLRFRDIERLDRVHAKLWELLADGNRMCVNAEQYKEVMQRFQVWCEEEFSGGGERGEGSHGGEDAPGGDGLRTSVGRPPSSSSPPPTPQGSQSRRSLRANESSQGPVNGATKLGEVLFLSNVKAPRPTMELFLSCPRNTVFPDSVDISVIYQVFAKKVSLVKCEAELIMWDTNNDGRLSEDEMESYVRDLVPRMAALQSMSEEVLPFYCCTASRRLFWDLDPGNRGVVRIDALLKSAVMDEWVSLQLLTEDNPRNWFGAMATQQLYEKFLLLDTRNEGVLNASNLRRYKKGLPTVLDDGLPADVSPLSTLFIDRFFETNVMMANSEMDYRKFVDFVIAVEMLPQCSRPAFFWNILDLHGDGVVTAMVANCFFRETHAKLVSAGLDVPARETVIQEVFDLIPTAEPLRIRRDEFMGSPQAGLFVALLTDCLSFWAYENREQR